MCDTLVIVEPGRVLFAKNSDRDPNEAQVLDWQPACDHAPGAKVECTHVAIDQAPHTHAILLSRPHWMFGAEIGANEHGLVIGNEAVFTKTKVAAIGLTGMDLLRLALERASSAEEAVEVITGLLARHEQGGGCGHEDRSFRYHSSFLIADRTGAFVLETAGQAWAIERVRGARSISNALSIDGFASSHSDIVKTRVSCARTRRARTSKLAEQIEGVSDLPSLLRDHGGSEEPTYHRLIGTLDAPCMHGGGMLASSVTTASWVAELGPDGVRHWVTGTAGPCVSIFKPARVDQPIRGLGDPGDEADEESLFWRHERLHRRVMKEPERLRALFVAERDEIEASFFRDPVDSQEAFDRSGELLKVWTHAVSAAGRADHRPGWARRYWAKRDRRAGLSI